MSEKRGRKRTTVTDCPGMDDPMRCLECEYSDCMLHDHMITRGGVSKAVEEALAGSWAYEDRNIFRHDVSIEKRKAESKRTKLRREANVEALAEKQACIREARERRGMMQKDAARLIGVSQATLSMWEHGQTPAPWERLHRFFPEIPAKGPEE